MVSASSVRDMLLLARRPFGGLIWVKVELPVVSLSNYGQFLLSFYSGENTEAKSVVRHEWGEGTRVSAVI